MMYQRPPQSSTASAPAMLGQVLGLTAVGFLVTAAGSYLFQGIAPGFATIAFFIGFGLLFGMRAAYKNPPVALLLFYVYTFVMGVFIAPIISRYTQLNGNGIVFDAAAATGMGMAILGGIAFTFSVDWRRFSGIAFGLLIALIVVALISAFTNFLHPTVISWLVLGVFSLLTLIDFSRIRASQPWESPIQLAVSIYLDALNIFLAFLQIFGNRRS